ncbi:MAG: molybdenum cofactor guanylyltransferase [Planctomycetes bacterium]|nr:molybdenum cofactor guanylyltransferase [Planctomycetota bacterium]MBI3834857.1 molybdenum cofactor guanylyltransferase [Planctomycetota bacterium]
MRDLVAGVLIGGQSRRMGTCKALLRFQGRTLVERAVEVAAEIAADVVLLGNCNLGIASLDGITQLADATETVGPMGGLCSLLEYASTRWSLLLACDMPLVDAELLERLRENLDGSFDVVAFERADRGDEIHACCAMYHPRVFSVVRAALSRGDARLQSLLHLFRCRRLVATESEVQKLTNVNTPHEFARLPGMQSKAAGEFDFCSATRSSPP